MHISVEQADNTNEETSSSLSPEEYLHRPVGAASAGMSPPRQMTYRYASKAASRTPMQYITTLHRDGVLVSVINVMQGHKFYGH